MIDSIGEKIAELGDAFISGDYSLAGLQRIATIAAGITDDCLLAGLQIVDTPNDD